MPNIMRRKYHWAERAKLWIMLVPMIVKTLHGVGGPSLSQQQRRSRIQFCKTCSLPWVQLWAESVEVVSKEPHHVGIVSKVDRFDFTSQTALTHSLIMQAFESQESIGSQRIGKGIQSLIFHDEVKIAQC